MELIKDYVDRFFKKYPNTQHYRDAKKHFLELMSLRLTELLEQGMPEYDALSVVFKEYGNLEIIAEELGHNDIIGKPDRPMNSFDANAYLQNVKQFSKTAVRTAAVILFSALVIFVLGLFYIYDYEIGFIIFPLAFLIPSLVSLIIFFRAFSNYRKQERGDMVFESDELKFVFKQEKLHRNGKNKSKKIICMIILLITMLSSIIIQTFLFDEGDYCFGGSCSYGSMFRLSGWFTMFLIITILMVFTSISILLLIQSHIEDYAYYRLLGGKENKASKQNLMLAGVITVLAVLLFFIFPMFFECSILVDVWPWTVLIYLMIAPLNYAVKNRKLKREAIAQAQEIMDRVEPPTDLDRIEYIPWQGP